MELPSDIGVHPLNLAISIAAIIFPFLLYRLLASSAEAAVPYDVELPEPCRDFANWSSTAEVLKSPSIKIPKSSAIQCYCPANGKLLGRINPSTADGIDRAIEKAKDAQVEWAKTTFAQRRKVLRTMLKYILDHQDDIVRVACLDSGKTRVDAAFGEVLVTAEKLAWTIKHGEKALLPDRKSTNLLMCYKRNEIRFEPLGVVAACVSWNYPFHNLLNPIISSIFAGNAVIVKASEQTAWSAQYFTALARGALTACSHSPQLIQSVICWPSVAPHLTSHPDISYLTFIGSRPIAHSIASSASKSLTPLCLELGGKDAALILDSVSDKELPRIASILMRGVFQSSGQNCIGIERVIACPQVHDKLLALIEPRVRSLRTGSALDDEEETDTGACISPAGFANLEQLIQDAVAQGATLHAGGSRYAHPRYPSGHYFAPTLLSGVTPDMAIAQNELFGPVFTLMRATSTADAVAIANSTPYALGASVFGRHASADVAYATANVRAGMVSVNDFACYYMCSLPFGGVAGSGYGRFGGAEGLRALCNPKSVCADRFAAIATSIPPRLDYALRDDDGSVQGGAVGGKAKAWEFVKGVVGMGYGITWGERASAIGRLIKYG